MTILLQTNQPSDDQIGALIREAVEATATLEEFEAIIKILASSRWPGLRPEDLAELVNQRILEMVRGYLRANPV